MIYFTADTHFGHANILKHCDRPWKRIRSHDEDIVANWNAVVRPSDTVYHLGDFAYRCAKHYVEDIYRRLNGTIYVIPGGHDYKYQSIYNLLAPLYTVMGLRQPIVLCHYPLLTWWNVRRGAVHLHGHCHGRVAREGRRLDVGVDSWGYVPVRLTKVMETL